MRILHGGAHDRGRSTPPPAPTPGRAHPWRCCGGRGARRAWGGSARARTRRISGGGRSATCCAQSSCRWLCPAAAGHRSAGCRGRARLRPRSTAALLAAPARGARLRCVPREGPPRQLGDRIAQDGGPIYCYATILELLHGALKLLPVLPLQAGAGGAWGARCQRASPPRNAPPGLSTPAARPCPSLDRCAACRCSPGCWGG